MGLLIQSKFVVTSHSRLLGGLLLALVILNATPSFSGQDNSDAAILFEQKNLVNPLPLEDDPYIRDGDRTSVPLPSGYPQEAVCGVLYESDQDRLNYRLHTFESREAGEANGAFITHLGPCGTCSSLQDLAVYIKNPNLTKPARRCAMISILPRASMRCFESIGFTESCAKTWYYNSRHTGKKCLTPCLKALITGAPNNNPDGSLNDCLQCDEDFAGPIFKNVAGRNRRNSGLRSAIERPEAEVADIVHDYY